MKRWLFRLLALLVVVAASEALFFGGYYALTGRAASVRELSAERDVLTGAPARSVEARHLVNLLEVRDVRPIEQIGAEVLHPYLGYVFSPTHSDQARAAYGVGVSRWGFLDDKEPFHQPAPNRVIVGVFGGSVAWYLSAGSADALVRGLRDSPRFRDKEIVIVRAALFGYKQPQQLLALTYLLSMGAHFDVVINLDGFNEVVLPVTENVGKRVFPFFPRTWFLRAADSPTAHQVAGRITERRQERRQLAALASAPVIRYSLTANVAWKLMDRRVENEINREQVDWLQQQSSDGNYAGTGPFTPYQAESAMYRDLADKWTQASIQMHRVAQANGIEYFHFLQPNQYVEGSKPMTPEERAVAIDEGFMFAGPARAGYPQLIEAGKALQQAGVRFRDLTQVFRSVNEPVYRDNCCHLLQNGGDMMAAAIAAAIAGGS